MTWNSTLGLWLLGGFILYLIAAGRISAYLAVFNGSSPQYAPTSSSGIMGVLGSLATGGISTLATGGGNSGGAASSSVTGQPQPVPQPAPTGG